MAAKRLTVAEVERRLKALEKDTHTPFDFTHLMTRLDEIERKLAQVRSERGRKKARTK